MEKITNAFYFYFTFIFSKICQVVSTLRDDNCQVIKQRIFLWIYKKKKIPTQSIESLWKRCKRKRSYDTKVVTVKNYS